MFSNPDSILDADMAHFTTEMGGEDDGWVMADKHMAPMATPEREREKTDRKDGSDRKHRTLLSFDGEHTEMRIWEDSQQNYLTLVHRGSSSVSSVIFPHSLWEQLEQLVFSCIQSPSIPQNHVLVSR